MPISALSADGVHKPVFALALVHLVVFICDDHGRVQLFTHQIIFFLVVCLGFYLTSLQLHRDSVIDVWDALPVALLLLLTLQLLHTILPLCIITSELVMTATRLIRQLLYPRRRLLQVSCCCWYFINLLVWQLPRLLAHLVVFPSSRACAHMHLVHSKHPH